MGVDTFMETTQEGKRGLRAHKCQKRTTRGCGNEEVLRGRRLRGREWRGGPGSRKPECTEDLE